MSTRILVADSIPTHRISRTALLEGFQYDVMSVSCLSDLELTCATFRPELVILGSLTTPPAMSIKLLRDWEAKKGLEAAPVLCILEDTDHQLRLIALKSGARDVLPSPVPDTLMLASVRRILREAETGRELERRRATASRFGFAEPVSEFSPARRIAVVGSGGLSRSVAERLSAALGYEVMALRPDDALRGMPGDRLIDAYVVLSEGNQRGNLRALLPELRARQHSRHSAFLVLYPENDLDRAAEELDGGATDVAPDSSGGDELAFRLSGMLRRKADEDSLRQSAEESYRLAATDALTGLYNRRYAETYLEGVMRQSRETGRELTLMMIDIDHFKCVNDIHGHAAGDEVLSEVATRIRGNLRAIDLVSRHGGEEFLVVMPETDRAQAGPAADRLRAKIGSQSIILSGGLEIAVTVSIGVSVCNPSKSRLQMPGLLRSVETSSQSSLIKRIVADADGALYRAKADGRNCVNFTLTAA